MYTAVSLSPRDRSLLTVLSWTPATTTLILRASQTFDGERFQNERRLRERLQRLAEAGLVRSWSTAHAGGGLQNYYKLTMAGFQSLYGADAAPPSRAFFAEISPALFEHTLALAECIVQTLVVCRSQQIAITRFFRESELSFAVGERQVQPDCFFQFRADGREFNVAFEIDLSTESVDSPSYRSIRQKLEIYDAYQAQLLDGWLQNGKRWERPRYRVAFLTRTTERAYNILALAGSASSNPSRRLIYAATQASYLADPANVRSPIFLDHAGNWRALVDSHPSAAFTRAPVRLPRAIEMSPPL
ncbi:MAG TPA: replication-relaxation family protein [Pirellulales bacterium]|nr:replication-relaxation family protein [Pirellulales bacterium]